MRGLLLAFADQRPRVTWLAFDWYMMVAMLAAGSVATLVFAAFYALLFIIQVVPYIVAQEA